MRAKSTLFESQYENWWFNLVLIYLMVELARVQDVFPFLAKVRPGMFVIVLLMLFLARCRNAGVVFEFAQIRRIVMFVFLLFAYVPFAAGNRAAYWAALVMSLYLPFILSTVLLVNTIEKFIYLCKYLVLILLFVCLCALINKGRGAGGGVSDENDLCLFIVSQLPLVLFVLELEFKRVLKIFWAFVVVVALITIVSTFSRGGFVGLIVMVAAYWWFSKRKVIKLICIVCLGVGGLLFGGDPFINEMSTVVDVKEQTANVRLLSWEAAWDMFLDMPWGVGGNNFGRHFHEYQSEEFPRSMWGRTAHSLWFTLISETGVIGIIIYLSIISLNFRDLIHIRRHEYSDPENKKIFTAISVALISSLFGFFAAGTFISVLYYPTFWYLTTLVMCIRNIHGNGSESFSENHGTKMVPSC